MAFDLWNQAEGGRYRGFAHKTGPLVEFHHVLGAQCWVIAKGNELRPRATRFDQAPKFSSDSKRMFGLCLDAGMTVLPMASAVVFTKHS